MESGTQEITKGRMSEGDCCQEWSKAVAQRDDEGSPLIYGLTGSGFFFDGEHDPIRFCPWCAHPKPIPYGIARGPQPGIARLLE
jgi:hypothetical protein